MARSQTTLQASLRQGGDPLQTAELILKIARTHTPRMRYSAGGEARWLPYLKVLLPQRLFDSLIRRGFGLKKQ